MVIEFEGKKFDLDIEKTKKYYTTHTLCDCIGCRNFYIQANEKYPILKNFLEKFGIDISKPDEVAWGDIKDGELDYIVVHYTVNGKILENDGYEIDITDTTFLSIVFKDDYVPNNQKEDEYFTLSVFGINLPYVLDETFLKKEDKKKLLDIFKIRKK